MSEFSESIHLYRVKCVTETMCDVSEQLFCQSGDQSGYDWDKQISDSHRWSLWQCQCFNKTPGHTSPTSLAWVDQSFRAEAEFYIYLSHSFYSDINIWPLSVWSPASPVNVTLPETDAQWCQMSDRERGLTQSLERQVWLRIWGVIVVTFLLCHLWCVPGLSHNSVRDLWRRD